MYILYIICMEYAYIFFHKNQARIIGAFIHVPHSGGRFFQLANESFSHGKLSYREPRISCPSGTLLDWTMSR